MKRTAALTTSALGAGLLLALAAPLSASAHVGVTATSTAAGSYSVLTFGVGHGCDGSPTTSIAISIPEAITSVTPTVNPNWTISETMVPLEPAVEDQTERVSQVIYTAKDEPLDAHQRDTFELSLQLPAGEVGDVVGFVTTQTTPDGATEVWEGDDVPSVILTAAVEGDGHGEATDDHHAEDEADAEAASATAPASSGDDVLARVLGIGGLVLGAVGVIFGITARRSAASK